MRVAGDQLVVHRAGHVREGELSLLGGQGGVKDDLEEQVAQLLLQMRVADRAGVQLVDRLQYLVSLLKKVAGERAVCLALIPWAAGPQGADELGEALQVGGYR